MQVTMTDDLEQRRLSARWRHLGAPIRRPALLRRTPSPVAPETPAVARREPIPLVVDKRYTAGPRRRARA